MGVRLASWIVLPLILVVGLVMGSDRILLPDTLEGRLADLERQVEILNRTATFRSAPASILGYVEAASQAGIPAGLPFTNLTGMSTTVTVKTRRILKITGHVNILQNTSAATSVLIVGSNDLGDLQPQPNVTLGAGGYGEIDVVAIKVVNPGTYEFHLTVGTGAGTLNTIGTIDGTGSHGQILIIEDVGAG